MENQGKELVKVEGNIIETLPIHYEKGIRREEKPFRETVKLSSGGAIRIIHPHRLWTGFDLDVMMSVFLLSKLNGEARRFSVNKKDILDVLGLKYTTSNVEMVKDSLEELSSTIYYEMSFYDVHEKKYISATGATQLFSHHLVTKEEMKQDKVSGRDIRKKSFIALGEIIWESLKNGYYKLIDLRTYQSLRSGQVRRAYLYIEKRLGRKNKYPENIKSLIRNITGRDPTANDVDLFKRRTLAIKRRTSAIKPRTSSAKLSDLYNFKTSKGNLIITRKEQHARQAKLFAHVKQPPLTGWALIVLENACRMCGRNDKYFKNTITKYIRRLGPDLVRGAVYDTQTSQAESKDKYLIHLLKTA